MKILLVIHHIISNYIQVNFSLLMREKIIIVIPHSNEKSINTINRLFSD